MALLSIIGAYPTIVALLAILQPLMGDASIPIRAAVLVPLMVGLLTYVVMPILTSVCSDWLSGKSSKALPTLLIATALVPATALSSLAQETENKVEQSAIHTESTKSAKEVSALDGMVVDHVMINVGDFERSIEWYRTKLGFEERVRWTVEGLKNTNLAYLQRGSFLIELASGPETKSTAQLTKATDFASHFSQRGITHLCFKVRDVDAVLAQLNKSGVSTFSPAIDFPALNCRVGFIQDPDGNVIEFKGPMAGNNIVNGKALWSNSVEK